MKEKKSLLEFHNKTRQPCEDKLIFPITFVYYPIIGYCTTGHYYEKKVIITMLMTLKKVNIQFTAITGATKMIEVFIKL